MKDEESSPLMLKGKQIASLLESTIFMIEILLVVVSMDHFRAQLGKYPWGSSA